VTKTTANMQLHNKVVRSNY